MSPGDGMEIKSREQVLNILKVLARRKKAKGNEYLLLSSFIAVSPPLPLIGNGYGKGECITNTALGCSQRYKYRPHL